ncbi:unnamed protein product [Lactuca saligna]|uniref:Alpha/beta hydrolase fold-3 domain-containing protein n=1 Tax=Lactuca saligna TaxID=75948 RepID=A0AA35UPV5_LACSI|nr:unnamed protein product [Lactuca saligna]
MEAAAKTSASFTLSWRRRILFSVVSRALAAVSRRDGTVNRRILKFIDFRTPASSKPINGVKTYDIVVDSTRKLWFRVFVPTQQSIEDLPVIIFFHGGGFVFLAPDQDIYDVFCRRLSRKLPAIIVSVSYRLAPEHRYPEQHDDCFDVLKFLDDEENCSKSLPEKTNISRCFVAGDSAGGNLVHHVAQRACEFNFQRLKVNGVLAIQPFFGGEERTNSEIFFDGKAPLASLKQTDWYWNVIMPPGESYNRDHPIINVSGPMAVDISKLDFPATMVVVAGFDFLYDWQKRYCEWLKKSGVDVYLVEYTNMFHAFYVFPELPESEQLMWDVKEFIQNVLMKVNLKKTGMENTVAENGTQFSKEELGKIAVPTP